MHLDDVYFILIIHTKGKFIPINIYLYHRKLICEDVTSYSKLIIQESITDMYLFPFDNKTGLSEVNNVTCYHTYHHLNAVNYLVLE